ncbi:hypothetical protein KSF73_06675 [Burkholderiaceae bacterium DAT-1]|nr:hypothetical protein [Burkholderiaceae bacterium DAT-1]
MIEQYYRQEALTFYRNNGDFELTVKDIPRRHVWIAIVTVLSCIIASGLIAWRMLPIAHQANMRCDSGQLMEPLAAVHHGPVIIKVNDRVIHTRLTGSDQDGQRIQLEKELVQQCSASAVNGALALRVLVP